MLNLIRDFTKFLQDKRTEAAKATNRLGSTTSSLVAGTDSIYDTRCIAVIANIISKSNIKAYRMAGDTPEEVQESDALFLLNNPSPGKNLGDLLAQFTKDMLIHNRFWAYYDEDVNSLFVLEPMQVVYDLKNGIIDKLKHGNKELAVENIIFAQANGTEDSWSSTTKSVSGSRKFADLDALYEIENRSRTAAQGILKNRLLVSGMFTTDGDVMLTPEQRDQMETDMTSRYRGSGEGSPLILQGVKYTDTGNSNRATEYADYIDAVKKEILGYRGVPELLITNTSVSTNYSSNQALQGMFKTVINPMIEMFNQMVNIQLIPMLTGTLENNEYIDYDDQTPVDITEMQRTLSEMYQNGAITANEYRVPLGLPEREDGDVLVDDTQVDTTGTTKDIFEEVRTKERAVRINTTRLKARKIYRDAEKFKSAVKYGRTT